MAPGSAVVSPMLADGCSTSATNMKTTTTVQSQARRWRQSALVASTLILAGALAARAFAQTVPAAPAATDAATGAQEDEAIQMMEFFVAERGVSRANNTVTPKDVQVSLPGATIEKMLTMVPGVNITSSDPFGHAGEGGDIRVRSFGIGVVAVTVDDVPMGSNSARYGTPAGRIVDSENLASISVSQGTGDVTTPAFQALGGSIKYYTTNPGRTAGIQARQVFGSWDFRRTFLRVDTGEILPGVTAFVSTSDQRFKTLGMPDDSMVRKLDAKIRWELPRSSINYSFTWNDRDDFDAARSIRWDYWRAMETGDPYAGYDAGRYSANERRDLGEFARLGYGEYTTANSVLTGSLMKDYGDTGRNAVRRTTLDSSVNLGDAPNSSYYYYGKNGRMDGFSRLVADHSFSDSVVAKLAAYYQHKQYFGTAYVPRSTVLGNIASAYRQGDGTIREDIWPRYAYMDATRTQLVPYGTPGALPVGFTDLNGNGIFDLGEKLEPSKNVTAFTATGAGAHALISPEVSTTLANAETATRGATARDEEFGGYRFGWFPQVSWTVGNHKLTGGYWYEKDVQTTTRPQYDLFEGSPTGRILYDRVFFNSYDRYFLTESAMFFVEDVSTYFDERLTVTLGAKSLKVDRAVSGMIDGSLWFKPVDQQYAINEVTYKDDFLPQAGLSYRLSNRAELFASYAVNIAAPTQDVVTSLGFSEGLSPEKATNYEAGVRFSSRNFGATFALFHNAYEERLLTVPLTQEELDALGIAGVVGTSVYRNVGGIDSRGAELSFDWRPPVRGLRLAGSVAYQTAEFEQDLRVSYQSFMGNPNDPRSQFYVPIVPEGGGTPQFAMELQKGKSQGNTPELTANADLSYTWRFMDMSFGGRYYDNVWANTMNTEKVPSFTTFRASFTMRGRPGTRFEGLSFSVNAENLFDQYFFTSSGGTGAFNGSVTADYGRTLTFAINARY